MEELPDDATELYREVMGPVLDAVNELIAFTLNADPTDPKIPAGVLVHTVKIAAAISGGLAELTRYVEALPVG